MLNFLPAPLLALLSLTLMGCWLSLFGVQVLALALLQVLLPFPLARRLLARLNDWVYIGFLNCLAFSLWLTNRVQWTIELPPLSKQHWYLIMANHQSWSDIIVLMVLLRHRTPPPKFFFKRELLWVPFVGLGAWALNMPMMKRYSTAFLKKHPHLRGKDLEATRRSCERFRQHPTTVVNFVEGTRGTAAKRAACQSPYQHLMPAKAGGIAFTLGAMGELFDQLLDVTLVYPGCEEQVLKSMIFGRLQQVVVRCQAYQVDEQLMGDYFTDRAFRIRFQQLLNARWQAKDLLLTEIYHQQQTAAPLKAEQQAASS